MTRLLASTLSGRSVAKPLGSLLYKIKIKLFYAYDCYCHMVVADLHY